MKNIALVLILGLINLSAMATSATQQIRYSGQQFENFDLSLVDTVTRYRSEMRDTTCTRQVPYETEECRNETRYREECRFEPGRNVCRTEYERRCRTVTRYRQECRQEPGRQVCRQTDPQRICRNGRCRTIPGRRICDRKPGRRVCRRVPYQERECTRVSQEEFVIGSQVAMFVAMFLTRKEFVAQ